MSQNTTKQEFVMPSDAATRQKIKNAILQASDSMLRVEAERELMKSIAANIKEEVGMPPALFNKLAKIHHDQSLQEVVNKTESLVEILDILFQEKVTYN